MYKRVSHYFSIPLTTLAFAISLSGCAVGHTPLSGTTRAELRAVSVGSKVQVPEEVVVFGTKQATFGALGGALGAALGEAVLDDKAVLKSIIKNNDIQVGQIFRAELQNELKQAKVFPEVVDANEDARFTIVISGYGLFKKGTFNGALRPAIWANVSLTKPNGEVIWQKRVKPEMSEDRLPAHDLSFYKEHPDVLRQGFAQASGILAKEIIEDLRQ